jgi:hypothetical protein
MDRSSELTDAVSNSLQYHMTDIVSGPGEDERDYLRVWRRRFRDAVASEKERFFGFLKAAEITDTEFVKQLSEAQRDSEWLKRNIVPRSKDLSSLEAHLGYPLADIREALHKAMERYNVVIRKLFKVEEALLGKLQDLRRLEKSLEALADIDLSGSAGTNLQTAIDEYIVAVFHDKDVQEEYNTFCELFAEWNALRGLVLGPHVAAADAAGGPICSICTTEKISVVLLPCGHTFCNNCGLKQRLQCYICRTSIRERNRIYFV